MTLLRAPRAWIWGVAVVGAIGCKTPSGPVGGGPGSGGAGSDAGDGGAHGAPVDAAAGGHASIELTGESRQATWRCTGSPCPWGASTSNHVIAWPAAMEPVAARLGYTASPAPYLPAARGNGLTIAIATGGAELYAGELAATTHRLVAKLAAGQHKDISGLAPGEVLSVQSDRSFGYRVTTTVAGAGDAGVPDAGVHDAGVHDAGVRDAGTRDAGASDAGSGPPGEIVRSIAALWRCNPVPGCFSDPWTGAVISWPSWSAYQSNDRPGNVSRSVYSTIGEPLYPYMAAWAEGCEVTAESGLVQVVEWKRGSESWRSTLLKPRESHVIHLVPPEDGALIEAEEGTTSFSVSLRNCTPQRIQP